MEAGRRAYDARATIYTAEALAWALHRAGDDAQALPLVEEATRLGTLDPALRVRAAAILAASNRASEAKALLAAAVERAGWLEPSLRPVAAEVCDKLGLDLPAAWR